MLEKWRNRVPQSPADKPGGSGKSEKVTLENLGKALNGAAPETKPEKKKLTGKERAANKKKAIEISRQVGLGDGPVTDREALERALASYAERRLRMNVGKALVEASAAMNKLDYERFVHQTAVIEQHMTEAELPMVGDTERPDAKPTEERKPITEGEILKGIFGENRLTPDALATKPGDEPKDEGRMTEEELLKGLEGLAPKDESAETTPRDELLKQVFDTEDKPDADMPKELLAAVEGLKPTTPFAGLPAGASENLTIRDGRLYLITKLDGMQTMRPATSDTLARYDWEKNKPADVEKVLAPEKTIDAAKAAPKAKADEDADSGHPEEDGDVVGKRKNAIKQAKKSRDAERKEAKRLEREARVDAAVKYFLDATERGADGTVAFQLAGQSLPEKDRDLYIGKISKHADLNGTRIEEAPDILALGSTEEEILTHLGAPAGNVGRIQYWQLPDGVAILDRSDPESAPQLQTIREHGRHRFPLGWHKYEGGQFVRMTDEEIENIHVEREAAEKASREAGHATSARAFNAKQRAGEEPRPHGRRGEAAEPAARADERPRDERGERTEREERPERAERGNEAAELLEMTTAFMRTFRAGERQTTAPAFWRAIRGKSERVVERFIDHIHRLGKPYPHRDVLNRIWEHAEDTDRRDDDREPRRERVEYRNMDQRLDDFEDRLNDGEDMRDAWRTTTTGLTAREVERFYNEARKIPDIDQDDLQERFDKDKRPKNRARTEERGERTETRSTEKVLGTSEIRSRITELRERARRIREGE